MTTPFEVLNIRYGGIFLSRSKNKKIVSENRGDNTGTVYATYNALLNIGTINPVVLVALVKGNGPEGGALLQDLDWESVHVRSYGSWDDLVSAGVDLVDTDPQRPYPMNSADVSDFQVRAISETENSKTYRFEQASLGQVTVFTSKPIIATGGNDLPRKTSFIPILPDANFVYERSA
jgi:hypothetical protein